jgi:DnaK suppressor protein
MTRKKLEEFKKLLLQKKEELETDLSNLGSENPKLKGDYQTKYPQYGDSLEDSAMELESYIEALPIEYRLEKKLALVKEAIKKIEKGKYGVCEKCGRNISEARLKIVPEAKFCVKCQGQKQKS